MVDKATPTQVGSAAHWDAVTAGLLHTCAVQTTGNLWCWGANGLGQLGDGTIVDGPSPTRVGTAGTWRTVAAGADHTCGLRTTGTLWCWGNNSTGQLGDGTTVNSPAPTQVGTAADWTSVTAAGAANEQSLLWGFSRSQTCGVRVAGTLWCWGDNDFGQLGDGTMVGKATPTRVGAASDWSSVTAAGVWVGDIWDGRTSAHTCGLRTTGTLWCWGSNDQGQLGDGSVTRSPTPTQVGSASDWSSVTTGGDHSCGTREPGTLWCWGSNDGGETGAGGFRSAPAQVAAATDWKSVALGRHGCGIRIDNTLWCWGSGQLGDGYAAGRPPTQVGTATDWTDIVVASDWSMTCGIRSGGGLWCWGYNDGGMIGDGTTESKVIPTRVGTATDWRSVTAGRSHACGVRATGTLWCWGTNSRGELGLGVVGASKLTPTQVGTATDWRSVTAGGETPGSHTCGIRATGTLWCWGLNENGQLGDGTAISKSTPTRVGTATDWRSVTASRLQTCAIHATGSLWCWGLNDSGQLGDGTTTSKSTPTQVGTATDWRRVALGWAHTCGVRTSNTLWCWGANWAGQLGDGTGISKPTPTQVGTDTNWWDVSAGGWTTIALRM